MSSTYSETVNAALAGRSIILRRFVELYFADGVSRAWDGAGYLQAGGSSWVGLGEWTSVSDIEAPDGGMASNLTVGLAGVPSDLFGEFAGKIITQQDLVKGGELILYDGVYDVASGALLDDLHVLWRGIMDRPVLDILPDTSSVQISAETVFARRAIAPYAYYSLADQQQLFPGDLGLEFVPSMVSVDLKWPPA